MAKEPLSAIFSVLFCFPFLFCGVRASTTTKKSAGAHREECAPAFDMPDKNKTNLGLAASYPIIFSFRFFCDF